MSFCSADWALGTAQPRQKTGWQQERGYAHGLLAVSPMEGQRSLRKLVEIGRDGLRHSIGDVQLRPEVCHVPEETVG